MDETITNSSRRSAGAVGMGKKEIRGFNQTEILFRSWARHMELPWLDILQRVRPTAGQYALTSQERYDNIKNAFAIKGNCASMVKGRHIIVVDDIYTTGATLDGCARVLKNTERL